MTITTVHHDLPVVISKSILKSMIGSLNATAIAYTRMHLRFGIRELPEVPTIDDLNDEMAAVDEQISRDYATASQGFNVPMATPELIQRLMELRDFFIACLVQMKTDNNDAPLSIAETIKFQMGRPSGINEEMIEALAAAVDMDPELLKAAQLKMVNDDAADLKANAGKIVDYLTQYDGVIEEFDDSDVEINFSKLPAHVQYKLVFAALRAHDKSKQKAMISLLRGKLDAAGDIKMLQAHHAELLVWLITFAKANRVELDAYQERGGTLPAIEDRTVVVSNTKAVSKPQVEKVEQHEAQAEASTSRPKAGMRRAPKPEAVQ